MLLSGTHHLPAGPRVRLRLPHVIDVTLVGDLLARLGVQADQLEVRRALRFDGSADTTTVCATAFVDGRERLVGLARGGARTGLLLADEDRAPGVGALLEAALRERMAA